MSILTILAMGLFFGSTFFTQLNTLKSPFPSKVPMPSIIPKPVVLGLKFDEWQYPNSTQKSATNFESIDDPQVITNWYVALAKSKKYSTTSIVKTNTNGIIKNKISLSNESSEISISISYENKLGITNIIIDK